MWPLRVFTEQPSLAAACAAVLRPSGEGAGPSRIAVMRSASSGNSILTTERRAWRMPSGWRSVSSSSIASPRPKREGPEGRSLASAGVRRPSGSGSARRRGVERGRGGRGAPSAALIIAAVRSSANTRIRGFVISMNWVMHAAPRRRLIKPRIAVQQRRSGAFIYSATVVFLQARTARASSQ